MEALTLTGATLNGEDAGGLDALESQPPTEGAALGQSHGHSHSHGHGHGGGSCGHPSHQNANMQRQMVPIAQIVAQKENWANALAMAIRGGPYLPFANLANAIRASPEYVSESTPEQTVFGKHLPDGHTLVHWAAKRVDDVRFVEYLLGVPEVDGNKASTDAVGMRPIHWAATEGGIPHAARFVAKFSKEGLMATDKSGCTPLLIAAQYGHADLAAFLVQQGADISHLDTSQDTALHWAAYKGSVPVCGLLLHLHSNHNFQEETTMLEFADAFGQTPLHLASLRGNVDVIQYLLEEAELAGSRATVARLLTAIDKDGKTPLDLAIKKNKVTSQLLLKQYMDRYCTTSSSNYSLWTKCKSGVSDFCSLKSWKVWMGMDEGSMMMGGTSPKFPFYFVVTLQTCAALFYPIYFMPILGENAMGKGVLWDTMGLHMFTLVSMTFMWIFYLLTFFTDPGAITVSSNGTSSSASYLKRLCCWWNDNASIQQEMRQVTQQLRDKYNQVLEAYADETFSPEKSQLASQSLCHSCHIARPLRSKHCRTMRRCVLMFDHMCPFVGNTIGLYNYKYFFGYLAAFVCTEIGFISTLCLFLSRSTGSFHWGVMFMGIGLSFFFLPVAGMLCYHSQLIFKNLTTNEHQNMWRYDYLKDPRTSQFSNPFDQGCAQNCTSRCFPGKVSLHQSSGNNNNNNTNNNNHGNEPTVTDGEDDGVELVSSSSGQERRELLNSQV